MAEDKKTQKKDSIPKETRQHYKQARQEMRESIRSIFPPEFIEHRRAARREMLLAARSLINHAIERLEKRDA